MKRISQHLPSLVLFSLFCASFYSCTKSSPELDSSSNSSSISSLSVSDNALVVTSGMTHSDSVIYNTLKSQYGLTTALYIPTGFQAYHITTLVEGQTFFNNCNAGLSQTYTKTGYTGGGTALKTNGAITDGDNGAVANLEGPADEGHETVQGDFSNIANMNITFDYTRNLNGTYNVSNVSANISGFTIGIGYMPNYSDITVNHNYGYVDFTVNGYYTAGITVGSSLAPILGYSFPYYFHVNYEPIGTAYGVTSGKGRH